MINSSTHWNGYQVIAPGKHRICVQDPYFTDRCLKFENDIGSGLNHLEQRAYQQLKTKLSPEDMNWFSRCYGFRETPYGKALQCEKVTNHDGSTARSLHDYIVTGQVPHPERVIRQLHRFKRLLANNKIPLFDLNAGNFLVTYNQVGGIYIHCADSKSVIQGKELIPFSRWLPYLLEKKVERRMKRLVEKINTAN